MRSGKQLVKGLLSHLGYDIRRSSNGSVKTMTQEAGLQELPRPKFVQDRTFGILYENFRNLASVYEIRLNELSGHPLLGPNPTRLQLLTRLLGTPPSEAYYLIQALAETRALPGDVCEFGVAQGETSALIANEIADTNKILHLFDSFQGLSKPTAQDELKDDIFALGNIESYEGTMMIPVESVLERLNAISFPRLRYIIHAGFIDQVLDRKRNLPSRVSFAYVDFDLYEPIRLALEFLDGVTMPGAKIVIDDYDFFSTGARTAVDEFVAAKQSNGQPYYELQVPAVQFGYFAILTRLDASRTASAFPSQTIGT